MKRQWLTLTVLAVAIMAAALSIIAISRALRPGPETEPVIPRPAEQPPAAGSVPTMPAQTGSLEGLPDCDFSKFAAGQEYTAVVSQAADLFGGKQTVWIIGYKSTELDEMGYPKDVAYFTLARLNASRTGWEEWFSLPAPDGEGEIDERSIMAVGDINEDGHMELVLRFYGFGVSARPENTYVFRITEEGSEPVSVPFPLEATSDDTITMEDFYGEYPGMELVLARAIMGDEPHGAPHRYRIGVWAWKDGMYREVKTWVTKRTFPDGILAIEDAFKIIFD
ncbi:MAG: hypothetical protein N2512_08340 [Armatimonadetes bacterium]|nr:hypothetical protein [Armatimonadota bacterium]